jgi:hypothetical protein
MCMSQLIVILTVFDDGNTHDTTHDTRHAFAAVLVTLLQLPLLSDSELAIPNDYARISLVPLSVDEVYISSWRNCEG